MALTATAFNYTLIPTAGSVVTSAGVNTNVAAGGGHGIIIGKQRKVRVHLYLNNATNDAAYPTSGGLPLSTTASDWGMIRNIDYLEMIGYGYHGAATGAVTLSPIWVLNEPATGGRFLRGFGGAATGAGPSTAATMVKGLPELPTTWTPTLDPTTPAFYFYAYGW